MGCLGPGTWSAHSQRHNFLAWATSFTFTDPNNNDPNNNNTATQLSAKIYSQAHTRAPTPAGEGVGDMAKEQGCDIQNSHYIGMGNFVGSN
jgi:hypothetical protein